jgi:hypothetical protein
MTDRELLQSIKAYELAQSETERSVIVEKIRNIENEQFKYFIKYGPKADWWNQAKILIALGFPRIKPILNTLFEWLQDMNWPGAVEIQENLLLKISKSELISCLDIVLRKAYWEGDSEWIYWLTLFVEKAGINRKDFAEADNAYDIITLYETIFVEGRPTFNYIELLNSWEYPRIGQFVFYVVSALRIINPDRPEWEQHVKILDMIPENIRATRIKEALQKLYETRGITDSGYLRGIIQIDETDIDFKNYIYS